VTRRVTAKGIEPLRARCYVHDEVGAPLAHRDTHWLDGVVDEGPWVHYLAGAAEMPAALFRSSGAVLANVSTTVWGEATFDGTVSSPLRYLGQYFDEETGLVYNRFRYYDPAIGQFISADPSGLRGGHGAFEYARSRPFRFVDPLGLQPVTTTVTSSDGTITGTGHSAQHPDHSSPQGIHPIVHQSLADQGPVYQYHPQQGTGSVAQNWPAGRPPSSCGEPHAMSNYIRAWEQQHNGGQPLDPNNPRDREKIQQCLGSVGSIGSQHDDGVARSPCPNCSQLFANLQARWGAPATSAIQPGFTNSLGTGPVVNNHPPRRDFDVRDHPNPTQQWLGGTPQYL
jgi:RHS repeat-associated protein